jgi:hypothetical protein
LLSLPTGNPNDFVTVLQHLIENAALVLLDALSEVIEDLPRFLGFALLNLTIEQTRVHGWLLRLMKGCYKDIPTRASSNSAYSTAQRPGKTPSLTGRQN